MMNKEIIQKLLYFLETHKNFTYQEVKMLEEIIESLSKAE